MSQVIQNLETALQTELALDHGHMAAIRAHMDETGKSFESALLALGYSTDETMLQIRGKVFGRRAVNLATHPIAEDAIQTVPKSVALKWNLIPLLKNSGTLTVAMANPLEYEAIDLVTQQSGCRLELVVSTEHQIQQAIERVYGISSEIEELLKQVRREGLSIDRELQQEKTATARKIDGPIAQILHLLIAHAVNTGASDIHLEPMEHRYRVRIRQDGVLHEVISFEKLYQAALNSSLKIMFSMDIAEKRVPQDGRSRITVSQRSIDIRGSSYPALHGEKIVLRILDKEGANIELNAFGFSERQKANLDHIIYQPHGIILVTGPTGSGKSTTLYAILRAINTPQVNTVTLEDPVEYDLESINQGQVHAKAGLTFAKGFRAIMRQDPDIIMVGEIRDTETAEIATQASLTGHLVLSTLHTNDAPGAVTRLAEIGVEPFLVASSLTGVLAQRLVRRLCSKCKEPYVASPQLCERFELSPTDGHQFYRAVGCRDCGRTGYRGRTGIYELMLISEPIRTLIVSRKPSTDIRQQAIEEGMETLQMDGLRKAMSGLTSIEEVLRVAGDT